MIVTREQNDCHKETKCLPQGNKMISMTQRLLSLPWSNVCCMKWQIYFQELIDEYAHMTFYSGRKRPHDFCEFLSTVPGDASSQASFKGN